MFRILGDGVKGHFGSNRELVRDVFYNLTKRYPEAKLEMAELPEKVEAAWDPGTVWLNPKEPIFRFELSSGFSVTCRAQHWQEFKNILNSFSNSNRFSELYDSKFYKIHGENYIICLSEKESEDLLKQVAENVDEYDRIAEETWKHLESAVAG